MPLGLGKKAKPDNEPADEGSRSRLFGGRSSKSKADTPASASTNPYAVQNASSTYAASVPKREYMSMPDPYAGRFGTSQSSISSAGGRTQYSDLSRSTTSTTQPPPYAPTGAGNDGFRNEKSAAATAGGTAAARFNNQGSYGTQGGYGANAYGEPSTSQRPGGYGGFGRSTSQDTMATEAGRNALLGDARERAERQTAQQQQLPPENGQEGGGSGVDSGHRGAESGGYGGYGDTQLTVRAQDSIVGAVEKEC